MFAPQGPHQGQDLSGPSLEHVSNVLVPGADVRKINNQIGLVMIELVPATTEA